MKIYFDKNTLGIQFSDVKPYSADIWTNGEGRLTVRKKTNGCSSSVWKVYSTESGARAAAKRLAKKLEIATANAEYNYIVDAWFEY